MGSSLDFSCPRGGSYYVCEDQPTRFVGCCTINPCITSSGLCPDNNLEPLSFNPDAYDQIRGQNCLDTGYQWYVCRDSSPPFLGCCSQDACMPTGCPSNKLGAASLSSNRAQAAPFLSAGSSSSTTTTTTTETTSSTSTSTSTSTTSRTPSTTLSTTASTTASATSTQPAAVSPPAHTHTGLSKGAIAGIAVGAVAGVCILVLAAFLALRQRRKKKGPSIVITASGTGRKDEYGDDSLTEYHDKTAANTHELSGAGAGQMAQSQALHAGAQPSPGLESPISELPATPSTPGNRHFVSVGSSDGVTGRESELSGISASPKQSPLLHQSLFELEDSSSRTFVGR
ncbi:hypothetical protein J3E69DRAFT_371341 [Trichoderma sp. SZMC 28015]